MAIAHVAFLDDALAEIVGAAAILMDGFPDEGSIGHVEVAGERLGLHAHLGPQVGVGGQYGDVGLHVHILQDAAHAGTVVVQILPVGEPCVLLVIVAAILDPSGECHIARTVVEAMPYGVGDTREGRHVGAYLDKFERSIEDEVSIGHLLTTYETLAGKMGCRGHILVYHRISAATAVVLVAHLFTQTVAQPVGSP